MARRAKTEVSKSDLDALYAADLDEFVSERNELAKRLRADGNTEGAERVKAIRKPTLPAWAINQGARSEPAAAKRLVKAGKSLAAAQEKALGGGGQDKLKEAMAAEGEAVEEMLAAVGESPPDGPELNSALLDRVRDTLRAVASDDELRAEFESARVTQDRKPVGFGGVSAAAPPSKSRTAPKGKPSKKRVREAEARERRAQREAQGAAKRLQHAENRIERARESLATAEQALRDAEEEKRSSDSELEEAESGLADARTG